MNIKRRFPRVLFQPPAICEGFRVLADIVKNNPILRGNLSNDALTVRLESLAIERGRDTIHHDSEEEFFADYHKVPDAASFAKSIGRCGLRMHYFSELTDVSVECPSRSPIDAVLNHFEECSESNRLPDRPEPKPEPTPPVNPKIFIGHGHSGLWRELKDHLTDKHGFDVIAYEVGARAGHSVRDILEDMLTKSSMAFLVLTGEDQDADGLLHPRENVIHETGLFQGKLGFSRGVVLLEKGTVEFSNIHGIDQLRFSKGNIKEVFGDVVATVRREFGSSN
jgi:hypothetical protein